MEKHKLDQALKDIEKKTNNDISNLGKLSEIDCNDMSMPEKRAYLRGFDRALEKDLNKPVDEIY